MTNHLESLLGKWPSAANSSDGPVATGMTRRDVLALLAALGATGPAVAQDPAKLAPRTYRVALENDKVRVLEYINRPGLDVCGAGRHYHPAHVTVQLTEVRVKVNEDGKNFTAKLSAGDVLWFEEQWHEVENVDKTATRVYIVELKSANWKPSTG
jgi:beta-alanine degradation protein BauB